MRPDPSITTIPGAQATVVNAGLTVAVNATAINCPFQIDAAGQCPKMPGFTIVPDGI